MLRGTASLAREAVGSMSRKLLISKIFLCVCAVAAGVGCGGITPDTDGVQDVEVREIVKETLT